MKLSRNNPKALKQSCVVISIVFSLLFHLFLIEGTGNITFTVPGVKAPLPTFDEDIQMIFNLIPEETVKISELISENRLHEARGSQTLGISEAARQAGVDINPDVEAIFIEADLYNPPTTDIQFGGVRKEMPIASAIQQAPVIEAPAPIEGMPAIAPRPEIVEIEYQKLTEERQNLPMRAMRPELERHDIAEIDLPSLAMPGDIIADARGEVKEVQLKATRPSFGIADFDIEMEDYDNLADDSTAINLDDVSAGDGEKQAIAFDSFVNVSTKIYPDEFGRGGYFEIGIAPNENSSAALRDIPKDLLFIIDRSTSISPTKFRQFQQAVCEALGHLQSSDRFNIVYFNDQCRKVFKKMAPATGRNIEAAIKAIYSIKRGGRTDVFNGLAPFVKGLESDGTRPFNIFLMTDGQSTVNIFKSNDFLRQITALNNGNVSIFPFSAGKNANRQLLDYLGYLNRGGKFHVDDEKQICGQLTDFITRHSSMLISDLHFTTNEAYSREIYPKALPHLYRNETLKLYGRYENSDGEIVLTLTGKDASGKTRDFVMRRRIADCARANNSLPLDWAGQKILWLSALKHCAKTDKEAGDAERQINDLRQQFRVYVPNN